MQNARGMTAIETVVWIGVFLVAMLAITSSLLSFYRTNSYTIENAQAVSSAQRGIDKLVKELRAATYSSNGAYPIVSMGADSITFFSNADTDPYVERLHYFIQNNTLYVGVANPIGDPLVYGAEQNSIVSEYAHNIMRGTPAFRYFDAAGVEITDYTRIADVRFVTITLIVNVDLNKAPNDLTLRSSAALRNFQ